MNNIPQGYEEKDLTPREKMIEERRGELEERLNELLEKGDDESIEVIQIQSELAKLEDPAYGIEDEDFTGVTNEDR
ncbi:MAG: hypothetical protein ACP5N7_07010 [Candidatus Pacearchaeota archaeon]